MENRKKVTQGTYLSIIIVMWTNIQDGGPVAVFYLVIIRTGDKRAVHFEGKTAEITTYSNHRQVENRREYGIIGGTKTQSTGYQRTCGGQASSIRPMGP